MVLVLELQPTIAATLAFEMVGAAANPNAALLAAVCQSIRESPVVFGPLLPHWIYAPCKPTTGVCGSSEVLAPKLWHKNSYQTPAAI